jgi:hypothetical protein
MHRIDFCPFPCQRGVIGNVGATDAGFGPAVALKNDSNDSVRKRHPIVKQ